MDVERTMQFILEAQARNDAQIARNSQQISELRRHAAETDARLEAHRQRAVETDAWLEAHRQHALEMDARLDARRQHAAEADARVEALRQQSADADARLVKRLNGVGTLLKIGARELVKLAEAQKQTDARIDRLGGRMEELSVAQMVTEQKLQAFIDSLTKSRNGH